MTAQLDVLTVGYVGDRVAGTVTLVRDGDHVVVIDPGMVANRDLILQPLTELGVAPPEVTDVVFSHHHPDHTINAALFPNARVHDFMATYVADQWIDREFEDGVALLSLSVRLLLTPGHSPADITTLVDTDRGLVACTHLWWSGAGPLEDPYADPTSLRQSRLKVLDLKPALIVPGHGSPFVPLPSTPV